MKTINTSQVVKIPSEGESRWVSGLFVLMNCDCLVSVAVQARKVTVKGPRGVLVKDFGHVDVELIPSTSQLKLQIWFGVRKHNACIRTVAKHIENMIKGVTHVSLSP